MNTKKIILISALVSSLFFLRADALTVLFPTGGGTGTSTKPTAGQVLVGQSSGIYAPQATSTLGNWSQWTTTSTGIFYLGNIGIGTVNPLTALHINGTTTLSTLTGILKGTSGVVGVATAGTDYVSTTTGNWIGTFQDKNSTDFLSSSTVYLADNTGNWAGTWQSKSPSDFLSSSTTYVATESDPIVKAQNGIITSNGSTISSTANNSSNWDTAYTDRLKWDGGSTGLTAATGRTSLGLTDTGTFASTTWAKVANNLSDLQSTSTARTNLGVDVTKATNIKTIGFNVFNATTTSTATTTVQRQFYQASTLSLVSCSTNGSNITISVEKRASSTPDTAGTSMLASLVCGSGGNSTSTFATSTIAENQVLTFLLTSVPNSTTTLRTYTKFLND